RRSRNQSRPTANAPALAPRGPSATPGWEICPATESQRGEGTGKSDGVAGEISVLAVRGARCRLTRTASEFIRSACPQSLRA
ncbi:MAG: hypothetical protein ACP5MD_15330, partial [Verrucomicrobiia bacterium]